MYDRSDIRKGLKIKLDNDPYVVVEYEFLKPGKGHAYTKLRVRNLKNGKVLDKTFLASEKFEPIDFEEREAQYLYNDGSSYHFMDVTNYEQFHVEKEVFQEASQWTKENATVTVQFYEGRIINVEVPMFVELKVVEAERAIKGDTATGANKSVTLETGAKLLVPLFINEGDVLKIDTRSGEYVERVR